jgi:SAM-dependent methyltransferase
MKMMDRNLSGEVLRWQEKLFKRSVRRQARLRKLQQLLGAISNQDCLEITSGDGMISRGLRRSGGHWRTLATTPAAVDAVQYFVDEPVEVLDALADIPDQSVDVVVVVETLERASDDRAFIRECHRVLRSNGRLVITTRRRLLFNFGAMLGLSWRRAGMVRPGYSTRDFFDALKDGFDVPSTATYSSCFVEWPNMFCEAVANKLAGEAYNMPSANADSESFYRYTKIYNLGTLLYPLLLLSAKLDKVFGWMLPGHNIAATTKRRVWRARRTPQLIDGRSIAEATLNTKIGTAAPF